MYEKEVNRLSEQWINTNQDRGVQGKPLAFFAMNLVPGGLLEEAAYIVHTEM
jgi:hypothetical protein